MLRLWLLVGLGALVSGCAAPKYNYAPRSVAVSEPPIGSTSTVRIGDTMLRQGKFREHDAIYLRASREISWAYTLHAGYYLKDGEDESAEFYSPGRGDGGGRVEKALIADPWKIVMLKRSSPELCIVTAFNAYTCTTVGDVERTKRTA